MVRRTNKAQYHVRTKGLYKQITELPEQVLFFRRAMTNSTVFSLLAERRRAVAQHQTVRGVRAR